MDDISQKLAARDSFLRKMERNKSPADRLDDYLQMRLAAGKRLQESPLGWGAFLRHQLKQRAINGRPEYFQ